MWLRRAAVIAVATLAGVGVLAGPAAAHNTLKVSNPAANSTVATPPESVTLTFMEDLDAASTSVVVTGPDGAPASDPVTVAGPTATAKLKPGAAGKYSITYKITGEDGHPVSETFAFTATAGNLPTAAPTTAAPVTSAPAPTTPVVGPAGATPEKEDDGIPVWAYVVGALAILAVLGGGLALGRRRSSS
ncbi:copper resistance CopC family protein [Longispora sp. NPDC051575]|uniref:copper resistance CopC family protein n=1 Tax=Longispora sp. NPDC051575 TaxID=3154943 RepID=UPI003431FB48